MSASRFRSPEDWKSAVMLLPDRAYFELMRSVFGNIKTPFNKQRLLDDLASFLSREESRKTIAAYMNETDIKVITAIAVLDEPAPGELESFFAGELTYAELQGILLNLEERLILYRFREEEIPHLALNPLLEPVLSPFIADTGVIFPSAPMDPGEQNPVRGARWDDRMFAALFAFAADEGEFYKAEGGIRKKVLDDGARVFPGLGLEPYIGGLQCLGLLRLEGERLELEEKKAALFGDLDFRERLEYYAAGMCVFRVYADPSFRYFHRGHVQSLARLIHQLIRSLDPRRRYPETTLRRLARILERKNEAARETAFEFILEALEKTGLLEPAGPGQWVIGAVPPGREAGHPVIAMDTAFSCVLYPGIGFAGAAALGAFCSAREVGTTVRFEVTRESVVRGFNRGMDSGAMLALLEDLSGGGVEQNLRWTLKDWETRYYGVSLHEGIVLTLSPERRYLTEAMAPMIARTLAPGVYLLSAAEIPEAVQALQKTGVDIIAQPLPIRGDVSGEAPHSPYPSLGTVESPDPPVFSGAPAGPLPDRERAEQNKEHFRSVLQRMSFSRAEREELAARIERRLVLCDAQLAGASPRYEKLEARGLDYVGKAAIAKQALVSKSLLEILWTNREGKPDRACGVPETLEKRGGETVLTLKTQGDPGRGEFRLPGEILRIPIGKISLLRRIKQSIFGE
ncbi:MAG: helicase-associated domain-containing protein [Spirochaetaceae bacterium]|jgi:hypothetical protein|nr:helicase-associated domain-containing protein [Spirochaetaceae bacterium]